MSIGTATIAEHSGPVIDDLIRTRAENGWLGVTALHLVRDHFIPDSACDPDDVNARLIVVAGGAASGKSTLAKNVARALAGQDKTSAIISSDDFVRLDRTKRHKLEASGMLPDEKYDFDEMRRAIGAICTNHEPGRMVEVPQYDSHTGLAIDGPFRRLIPKVDILIVEGDMLGERGARPSDLCPNLPQLPLTVYAHVPDTKRLARRVKRDLLKRNEQGATEEEVIASFVRRQETQHLPYTLTYASAADIITTPPVVEGDQSRGVYDMYTF